ncbi:MAG: DUF3772 domain-containing protein [Pseudomonadota bacterium]
MQADDAIIKVTTWASEVDRIEGVIEQVEDRIDEVKDQSETLKAEQDLARAVGVEELTGLRSDLARIRSEASSFAASIDPEIGQVKQALDDLGVPVAPESPASGEENGAAANAEQPSPPADGGVLAAQRKKLSADLARFEAIRRDAISISNRASSLITRIGALRRALFWGEILKPGPSPLKLANWLEAGRETLSASAKFSGFLATWFEEQLAAGSLPFVLARLAIGVLLLFVFPLFLMERLERRMLPQSDEELIPTYGRRLLVAGLRSIIRLIISAFTGYILLTLVRSAGLIPPVADVFARQVLFAYLFVVFVRSITLSVFSPRYGAWRLVPVSQSSARIMVSLIVALVIVIAIDDVAFAAVTTFGLALEISIIEGFISALIAGALLLTLSARGLWRSVRDAADQEAKRTLWRRLRLALRVIALLIIGAAIAGYLALAQYTVDSFVYLLALAIGFAVVRTVFHAVLGWVFARSRTANVVESTDTETGPNLILFWSRATIDFCLLLAVIPLVLLVLGVNWPDIRDYAYQLFLGVTIGGFTLSLSSLLVGLLTFVVVLFLTRGLQHAARDRLLPNTKLDIGAQHSLVKLMGYGGVILAIIAGISGMGFDLSNFAIIAGALSVGIGFGLQSIVNNFVSGLILLFERPIRIGDWVVTTSGEGLVKGISVRSTEIETFDRSSIILPNSELISSPVTNWTLNDRHGRIIIPVGVSYESDVDLVKEILMEVAEKHPLTLRRPAPLVLFQDFGASSLDFEVRVHLRDITSGLVARSDLRFEMLRALRDADVEIPFPQRDLNIRDMDRLEAALAGKKPKSSEPENTDDVQPLGPEGLAEAGDASDDPAG